MQLCMPAGDAAARKFHLVDDKALGADVLLDDNDAITGQAGPAALEEGQSIRCVTNGHIRATGISYCAPEIGLYSTLWTTAH